LGGLIISSIILTMHKIKKDVGGILHGSYATFRVWAPFAQKVEVTGAFNNWGREPMEGEGDGYWAATVKNAEAGQEYKYVINTGSSELFKNDPRSLAVTTSEGNSVLVDTAFEWEDDNFQTPSFNKQVLYEIHVGTFSRPDTSTVGTFKDVQAKLDYLAGLGVNMIQLMPICSMPMDRGWGYASDYLYAIESLYGGRRQFLELIKAAHNSMAGAKTAKAVFISITIGAQQLLGAKPGRILAALKSGSTF
jgi:1,4-alpha-glucan branching enzyme